MKLLKQLFDFRRMHSFAEGDPWNGMLWHKWTYWLNHGGWFYADLRRPLSLLSWWWRFAVAIPKQRGWRWD